jgi:hypothetical protein
VLENVEVVTRPYDQAGGEGEKEGEREVFFGGGGRGKDPTWKIPPPSRLERVALNGHGGGR